MNNYKDRWHNGIIFTLILMVGLSCFGIGLWLGLDSARAKVDMLEAKDVERTKIMGRVFITVAVLEESVRKTNKILKLTIKEEEKTIDYNEEALGNE